MKHTGLFLIFVVAAAILAGCKKDFEGAAKDNLAPETHAVTDTIIRVGNDRFPSQVQIQWWGSDPDGYITGYEVRINGGTWEITTKQDSLFTLIIPGTSDTFDFEFEVRAIDNKGSRDESPARLFYPVRNTAPSVNFYVPTTTPSRNPDRSFPALRFQWQANDLDGISSLDSFEISWNDTAGPYTKLPPGIRDVLLVGTNLAGTVTDCDIYLGSSQTPWGRKIPGLKLNDSNVLYIRAVDKVQAKSGFAVSKKVFVRKPQSDILVVNAVESQFTRASIQSFYTTSLAAATSKSFDILMATEIALNNYTELSPDPFTQAQVFGFFSRIFWFSDNTEFSLGLLQKSSSVFFSKGGRMLVISAANDNLPPDPPYLDFTPIKSYLPVSGNDVFLMNSSDSLIPAQPGWPVLTTPNFQTGIRPFEIQPDNPDYSFSVLYSGRILNEKNSVATRWTGTSSLIARRVRKSDNKTDFIVSVVPLHQFNGLSNFDQFMSRAVNTELEF